MGAIEMNLVERIESYWSKRSDDFSDLRIEELNSDKRQLWQDEIISNLPDKEHLKVLDVGCGPGFFSVILASLGHDVVGIDLTESMIEKAGEIADMLNSFKSPPYIPFKLMYFLFVYFSPIIINIGVEP